MMYQNKLVVALKANNKILREFKDTIKIPFGTEYSILIKNLNSVRASVNIFIDGTDIGEDVSFVINPKSEVELTRFVKNGNLDAGNRFKFIERTAGVEKHRGIQLEDGLIRVEFQFEQKIDASMLRGSLGLDDSPYSNGPIYTKSATLNRNARTYSSTSIPYSDEVAMACCAAFDNSGFMGSAEAMTAQAVNQMQNDAGITVPGSISDQKFEKVSSFLKDPEIHVMVLKLLGETEQGTPVIQPITVKTKPTCTTCGKSNKATAKFCSECGTSLQIV